MNNQNNSFKRIAIGSDHVGYPLKEDIKKFLEELGFDYSYLANDPSVAPNVRGARG